MPVYTCTTAQSALDATTKGVLARELASIHSRINHVPTTYVNVVFHALPEDDLYTDGIPAEHVLVIIGNSPARFAIEGGRVLPEPGQEAAWLREGSGS